MNRQESSISRAGRTLAATTMLTVAALAGQTTEAYSLPNPLPVHKPHEIAEADARQTLQRQFAIGIANYLNPDITEDTRRRKPVVELHQTGATKDTQNLIVSHGMSEHAALPTVAFMRIEPRSKLDGSDPKIPLFAEHTDPDGEARRIWMSATIDLTKAAQILEESKSGAVPDLNVLQELASDPKATFDTSFMEDDPVEGGFQLVAGSHVEPVSTMPVPRLEGIVNEYGNFIGLNHR